MENSERLTGLSAQEKKDLNTEGVEMNGSDGGAEVYVGTREEIDKAKAFKQLTNKVEIYEKAKKLVQYKYLFFKRQLRVNFNKFENNYMRECLRFIEIAINDLRHEYAHQISMEQIILNIEQKLKKSYDKDCQYVIETLMHGIIPHSNDSDVIWLKNILFSKEQKVA